MRGDEAGLLFRPQVRLKSVQKGEGLGEGLGVGLVEQQRSPQDMVVKDI